MRRIWVAMLSGLTYMPMGYGETVTVEILTDESYPPYTYAEDGEAIGIYPDIVHAIDEKLNDFDITIRPVPWKRGLKLIESGRSFALMPPYFHPESRDYISPYSRPMLNEEVVVFCDNKVISKSPRKIWPEDFYGLIIGINSGFNIGGPDFWQASDEGKLTVSEAKGNQLNLIKLRSRRIDCYVNDRISILWETKRLLEEEVLVKPLTFSLATHINTESGYMAYTNVNEEKYPYKEKFVREFDDALIELQNSGEIEKIVQHYTGE
ncbi:substrate-binding periplasmic protein [Vibrio diazotrophicus]|uniref:substrate-binding periplasmic protein n=1 Tax=Vibrio diazotrophicus TaxID=685 RepID=UPI0020CA286D|nr:transporter substrate-binding domain-containing protein [Vibrio diazotrophicus]